MSLQRQLLVILFAFLSLAFFFKAGFLTIQHFLIIPSNHPLLVQAQMESGALVGTGTASTSAEISQTVLTTPPNTPVEIELPNEHIDLPIFPTTLEKGTWTVSTQGVSLLEPNGEAPEEHSGLILYGHNWSVLLGRLHQAKLGQTMTLTFPKRKDTYQIVSMFTVNPDQLDVLNLAQPNTVLLYTCTGFMDSQRLVVLAQKL